jgi:pimeloyl-ACP methyl ester carboxylesterase
MERYDDDLTRFEAEGVPLPPPAGEGHTQVDGARLWRATYSARERGIGTPVILLHGGLGHSGNWGHLIPALVEAGYRVTVIDTRGHGRSTRDARPYSYELLADDVTAVMDDIGIPRAALVGWSDGACAALVLAARSPERVSGVFFFACNMDPSGAKEFEFTPEIGRCLSRHRQDYARLSVTPEGFEEFSQAVSRMQATEPNFSEDDLIRIRVPVTVAHAERDEFIRQEHAEYLARTIPAARFVFLPRVSHFAPVQRPDVFNAAVMAFLERG